MREKHTQHSLSHTLAHLPTAFSAASSRAQRHASRNRKRRSSSRAAPADPRAQTVGVKTSTRESCGFSLSHARAPRHAKALLRHAPPGQRR